MNAGYEKIIFGKGTGLTVDSSMFSATYSKLRKGAVIILKLKKSLSILIHSSNQLKNLIASSDTKWLQFHFDIL